MNKSQRIYLDIDNPNTEKFVKVRLEQNVNSLEFLTMSIDTNDVYRDFNSDYGVLVGRVIANGGIGIPNARISIFIPLTDEDAEIGEIASIYPYKTPRDKNSEGKRYNLLPRVAKVDPTTGIATPKQPFGSFPIKEEIVVNEPFLNVYKKYYKYTALTNSTGDYMIFGVPVGTQTVHLSVDITDIGKYSMTPASMVKNLGYSENLFTEGNSKIKPSNDLGDLPHIETQEIAVDIIPFWGDTTNFEIGITRQDFRIRSVLQNTFVIFGSAFTDSDKNQWGSYPSNDNRRVCLLYRMTDIDRNAWENIGAFYKRPGLVTEKIYYYPENVTDAEIAAGTATNQMLLLDKSEYSFYKQNGDFVFIINCNRNRVIIDEQGNIVPAGNSSQGGLYTEFKGFITIEIDGETLSLDWTNHGEHVYLKPIRQKLKFPQYAEMSHTFRNPAISGADVDNEAWVKQYFTFCGGGIYSLAKFHGLMENHYCDDADGTTAEGYPGFIECTRFNNACHANTINNAAIIQTNDYGYTGNTLTQMCGNSSISCSGGWAGNGTICLFGANWMNMSIYLPQTGWVYDNYSYIYCHRANSQFTYARKNDTFYMNPNTQQIAGCYLDTCSFARSDVNWTDIICVPKEDIVKMNGLSKKGFISSNIVGLSGTTYRNGTYLPTAHPIPWCAPCPLGGGKCNGTCTCDEEDEKTYFFKGIDTSDCVAFLVNLGIV